MAVFQVRDTGQGIKVGALPYIFELFRQGDGSHTRKAEGLGLGLTIARRLVQLHGGEMEIESEEGKGTVCTFTIPLASEGSADAAIEGGGE